MGGLLDVPPQPTAGMVSGGAGDLFATDDSFPATPSQRPQLHDGEPRVLVHYLLVQGLWLGTAHQKEAALRCHCLASADLRGLGKGLETRSAFAALGVL